VERLWRRLDSAGMILTNHMFLKLVLLHAAHQATPPTAFLALAHFGRVPPSDFHATVLTTYHHVCYLCSAVSSRIPIHPSWPLTRDLSSSSLPRQLRLVHSVSKKRWIRATRVILRQLWAFNFKDSPSSVVIPLGKLADEPRTVGLRPESVRRRIAVS